MDEPTNRENALRIDYLEERQGKHSHEWDLRFDSQEKKFNERYENFDEKLEKVMDRVASFAEKYMEKLNLVEKAALDADRSTNMKLAKIVGGITLLGVLAEALLKHI